MLEIINNLEPFFEDCYNEMGVREYSREMKMSAPTASKILKDFEKEGLLKKRLDRRYLLFRANRESRVLRDLSRIYWGERLKELIDYLKKELHFESLILFGSLAKLEVKKDSDIDIVVISKMKKDVDLKKFEKKYRRGIQLLRFDSVEKINTDLKINVFRGYNVSGGLE